MSGDLVFRKFDKNKDFAGQRELFALAFPETKGTPVSADSHYSWKFEKLNHNPPAYEFVAEQEGDIVGYYAALPYTYIVNGQQRTCGMVCDVMTHPKMRGKGVFTKIGRFSTDSLKAHSVDFVSGYPIRPEVIPGHMKVGWFVAFKNPMFLRPLRSNAFFKRRWAEFFVHPISNFFVAVIQSVLNGFNSGRSDVDVMSQREFLESDAYEEFYTKWEQGQKNYLVKTKEFLQWRTSAPESEYSFFVLSEGQKFRSVSIVRKVELKGIPVLAILDFMALPDLKAAEFKDIHRRLYRHAKEKQCDAIVSMLSWQWARRYKFLRFGFLPTPAVFSIIFKLLKPELDEAEFSRVQNWHLMWIDSDDL